MFANSFESHVFTLLHMGTWRRGCGRRLSCNRNALIVFVDLRKLGCVIRTGREVWSLVFSLCPECETCGI
jgi:hypothetical protein